ncbi:8-oxo-dGTP pyrophosphatase MutT (NUDIX family) [Actinoplanes lutulentus]|uniref:ADP-ribose pyrophosphatase YjhB (NUDIX family) n=1 Tax=Actinoplanes lutulentus TaxID=1287878 RepID=A0A327Z3R1_9ACTN|nr:NUDIX domain-containing protein [Actinoplanes lutulentus]MBB2942117.1 8-oxo-dGTP pyrophosphatase MutT (NUDIX family) [Actinoplanes lutulentus]RAK26929.1 ADP-ribose pyrophosphatase YjhB (NUDIX family) [Actinoplanes lutulentus]
MATPEFILELRKHIGHAPLPLPSVTAVVFDSDGRLLLNQRSDDRRWSLLAGVLEPGEQPAAGAAREVFEETAVDIVVERIVAVEALPLHTIGNGDQVYWFETVFACIAVGGDARVNDDESLQVAWFEPGAVPVLNERQTRYLAMARDDSAPPFFVA